MSLALTSAVLHGAACVLCLVYAYARRRSKERQAAYLLAIVWCGWFGLAVLRDLIVNALPPPGPEPLSGLRNRTLLALDVVLYFAWPAGSLAWIRWIFLRAYSWPLLVIWLGTSGLMTARYPALGGEAWFHYAGGLHLAALAVEIATIAIWARRRKPPRPWHAIAVVAAPISAFPALPFLTSGEARASYLVWVLRGLVALHLWCIAVLGGDLWNQLSRGS